MLEIECNHIINELPQFPPLPSRMVAVPNAVLEKAVEKIESNALRIETVQIYRCECQRCGYVWRTDKLIKPKACAQCHNSYWDRPALWTRKGRAERIRLKAERKIEKKAERASKKAEFRKKLEAAIENAVNDIIQEGGENISAENKRKAKTILKSLKDGQKAKVQETNQTETIYKKTMDVLGGMDTTPSSSVAEPIPDAIEEVFQGKAFRIVAPSIPIGYTIIDNQEIQARQSDAVGIGTDVTD